MEGTAAVDDVSGVKGLGPVRGMQDLPLALLAVVLRRVSAAQGLGGPLHFALVCRRFAALRFRAAVLRLRERALVPGPLLAEQLQVHQGPTSLKPSKYSVKGLRALWLALAVQGPVLTAVDIAPQIDTCVECEGECPVAHQEQASQLCARSGQASAWWAFSGPFLRAHPGLRSLTIREAKHYLKNQGTCSRCCVCSRSPDTFVSLAELRSSLPRLKHLSLGSVNLGWPQDWPSALPSLESLSLMHEEYLGREEDHDAACSFPWSILELTGLTSLSLSLDFPSMLDQDFGHLVKLRKLSLFRVSYFEVQDGITPPASIWTLTGLRSLSLANLGDIPEEGLGRLTGLTELLLNDVRLRSLPDSLQALEVVEARLVGLEGLQERFGRRGALRSLTVDHTDIGTLPADFCDLASLTDLTLTGQFDLEELPDGFGRLHSLKRLYVDSCPYLKGLSADFSQLGSLTLIDMRDLRSVEELPDNFGRLRSLQDLTLCNCRLLRWLSADFGLLATLTELRLLNLNSLEELPDGFGRLQSLSILRIRHCGILKRLPADFGELGSLTDLELEYLKCLEELPDGFGGLQSLRILEISHCEILKGLPTDFGQLGSLTDLELESLKCLERLPDGFGSLQSLRILEISHCKILKRLPTDFGQLASLTELNVGDLDRLEELPEVLVGLGQLRKLWLTRLTGLHRSGVPGLVIGESREDASLQQQVLPGLGGFTSLEDLDVNDCGPLTILPEHLRRLSLLQRLQLVCATRPEKLDEDILKSIPSVYTCFHDEVVDDDEDEDDDEDNDEDDDEDDDEDNDEDNDEDDDDDNEGDDEGDDDDAGDGGQH